MNNLISWIDNISFLETIDDRLKEFFHFGEFVKPYFDAYYNMNFFAQLLLFVLAIFIIPLGILSFLKRMIKMVTLPLKIGIIIAVVFVAFSFYSSLQ